MSAADRFFKVFVRPFAENPQAVEEARAQFGHRLEMMDGAVLDADSDQLDRADIGRKRKRWAAVVVGLLLFASFAAWIVEAYEITTGPALTVKTVSSGFYSAETFPFDRLVQYYMEGKPSGLGRVDDDLGRTLPPLERAWLFGSESERYAAAEARWRERPNSPARYLDYVRMRRVAKIAGLPADFVEMGNRLDPDNGWYALMAGNAMIGEATEVTPATRKGPRSVKTLNPQKLEAGLALIHLAASKPVLQSYGSEMLAERLSLIPWPDDSVEQARRLLVTCDAWETMAVSPTFRGMKEEFDAFAGKGDRAGMARVVADWESLSRRLAPNISEYLDAFILVSSLRKAGGPLRDSARKAGEEDLARRIERVLDSPAFGSAESTPRADQQWMTDYGSTFATFTIWSASSPLRDEDFLPQRKISQVILDRIEAWQGAMVMWALAAVIGIVTWRQSKAARLVAGRLILFLRLRDWAWICGLGIGLPALLYVVITRFTPLGCRDYSTASFAAYVFFTQAASALLLAIALAAELARWRMGIRAGHLVAASDRFSAIQWIMPVLCGMSFISAGSLRWTGQRSEHLEMVCLALAGGVAIRIGFLLFGKAGTAVFRLAVLRAVLPGYLLAALLLTATIPFSVQAERYWVKRDPLFDRDPKYGGYGRLQHEEVQRMKRLLTEALE